MKIDKTDDELYAEAFGDKTLEDAEEIAANLKIIADVRAFTGAEIDTLVGAFREGPLYDGNVPSKSGRSLLVQKGYMTRCIVKGEWGYNACTYSGAWAYKVLIAASPRLFDSDPKNKRRLEKEAQKAG